jgi:hypothetical protein
MANAKGLLELAGVEGIDKKCWYRERTLTLIPLIASEGTRCLNMLQASHKSVKFLGASMLRGKAFQTFTEDGIQCGVLSLGEQTSLLNEGFIGAERNIFHIPAVYTTAVHTATG